MNGCVRLQILETGQIQEFVPTAAEMLLRSGRAVRAPEVEISDKTDTFDFKRTVLTVLGRIETACLSGLRIERRG